MNADQQAQLRAEFPATMIGKLPKPMKKNADRGKCLPRREGGAAPDWQDFYCGGWHGLPAVHLDYVGHAAVTSRLLEVDPEWTWEPKAGWDPETGEPRFVRDRNGNPIKLWIDLTVAGVTRPGVGTVGAGADEADKQLVGNALRNAALRFGVAVDLWIKGHGDAEGQVDDGPAGDTPAAADQPARHGARPVAAGAPFANAQGARNYFTDPDGGKHLFGDVKAEFGSPGRWTDDNVPALLDWLAARGVNVGAEPAQAAQEGPPESPAAATAPTDDEVAQRRQERAQQVAAEAQQPDPPAPTDQPSVEQDETGGQDGAADSSSIPDDVEEHPIPEGLRGPDACGWIAYTADPATGVETVHRCMEHKEHRELDTDDARRPHECVCGHRYDDQAGEPF